MISVNKRLHFALEVTFFQLDQGNVFTGVCDSVHGGGVSGRENPPGRETPLAGRTPPWQGERPPPWQGEPPLAGRPPARIPLSRENPPLAGRTPPGRETPPGIRSMSGRYASYWNAFLFDRLF